MNRAIGPIKGISLGLLLLGVAMAQLSAPACADESIIEWIDVERFASVVTREGKSYWCGHLGVANVINYHVGRVAVTPEDVARVIGDRATTAWDVEKGLNHFGEAYHLGKRARTIWKLDRGAVMKEILHRRPVLLQTGLGGPAGISGHTSIIVAFEAVTSPQGDIKEFKVNLYDFGWWSSNNLGIAPDIIVFS
jgi:hypothetical protein